MPDLMRSGGGAGIDHFIPGGENDDSGFAKDLEFGCADGSSDGGDAGVDASMSRDEEITGSVVTACAVHVFAGLSAILGKRDGVLSGAREQLVGNHGVAIQGETGAGHDFPTLAGRERGGIRIAGSMNAGHGEEGVVSEIAASKANAIHHDSVVRGQWSVGGELRGEDAASCRWERNGLRSQLRQSVENEVFGVSGSDEGIHARPTQIPMGTISQVICFGEGGDGLSWRDMTVDRHQRPLRDLRISITDRCNFRCRYCMPAEVFGPNYKFLPREQVLRYEEIERFVRLSMEVGVRKVRLTGGEPLLRRGVEDLVGMLATVEGVEDFAMTTNGVLLAHHAEGLRLAGLNRVTVSLDALDCEVFARMNGVGAKVDRVLAGIESALAFGLGVKINAVVQRGVNEGEILPLVRWGRERAVPVRFIEFMDVGETNGWRMEHVVPSREIRNRIEEEFPLVDLVPTYAGEVARRYGFRDGGGEVGFISSVTEPFCGGCNRIRLSAEGKLFTCLFAEMGTDVRQLLREGDRDEKLCALLERLWGQRADRYSEERGHSTQHKVEMSYLGG